MLSATRRAGASGVHRTVEKDNPSRSWAQATAPHLQGLGTYESSEPLSHVTESPETDPAYRETLIRQEAGTDDHRPSRRELHPEGSRESCLATEDLSRGS